LCLLFKVYDNQTSLWVCYTQQHISSLDQQNSRRICERRQRILSLSDLALVDKVFNLLQPRIPLFWHKAGEMRNCERPRVVFPSSHGRQRSRRTGLHVSYVALHIIQSKTHSRTASARLFYPPGFQKCSVTGKGNTLLAISTMQKTSALGFAWFPGLRTVYQA
jgi:hypothetical protein